MVILIMETTYQTDSGNGKKLRGADAVSFSIRA
jgi:hypothetical protein